MATFGSMLKPLVPVEVLGVIDFFLRMGSMGGSAGIYVCTPLAYPTHIRATAMGFHYFWGRVGAVLAAAVGGEFNFLLTIYGVSNVVCVVALAAGASVLVKRGQFDALELDKSASVIEKREASFIKVCQRSSESA